MREKPHLSAGEYLGLTYAVTRGVLSAGWAALTGWSRGKDGPSTYGQHVIYSATRSIFPHVSVRMGQALNGTTRDQYKIWATKNKVEEDLVEIDSDQGIWGCWLGRNGRTDGERITGKTLLWFHGGGYVSPGTEAHFAMLWSFIQEAKARGETLKVLALEYDLAPHGVYPTQLRQAVLALQYLLSSGLTPSEILVGGDSAGGNLTLALLLHLSQPHPEIPPLSLSGNLAGAVLISPWVKFQTNSASYTRNGKKDALDKVTVSVWAATFMGKSTTDKYNTPVEATAEDWKDIKVEKLLFTSGSDELLLDDIRTLVDTIRKARPGIDYFEAVGEAHDAVIMDRAFGLKHELKSENYVLEWLMARLK